MLTCKTVSQKVSEGMDRPLTAADRLRVRLHLLICPACRRFERQLGIVRGAIRTLFSGALPDGMDPVDQQLPDDARRRIRDAMRR